MWYKWHRSWNHFVMRLTQRCGQRCPLLHVRDVWTRDPETWRSFYTLLYKLDLIWPALSCGDRNNRQVIMEGRYIRRTSAPPHSRWVSAGAFGGQRTGQLSGLRRFPLPLPDLAALPQEGEGEVQGGPGGGERQWGGVCWLGGIGVWHLDWFQLDGGGGGS